MFDGNRRWHWLTLLALCNLVVWVAIAGMVGLMLSDQVDLGLETELRQVQATAQAQWAAAWDRLSDGEPVVPSRSTSLASGPRPTATRPASQQAWPTSGVTWSEPGPSLADAPDVTGEATRDPGSAESQPEETETPPASPSASPPASPSAGSPGSTTAAGQRAAASGQGIAAGVVQPTPEPTQTLLSKPLLLADPEFHNLAGLNAEMARSVPGRVVQIRYQEATLNREINLLCEKNPDLPFRTVLADLRHNQVALSGQITVLGFQVDAWVTGTVVVRDCRPQIEIESITVAGVLTPQFIRDQIEHEVLKAMDWYPVDYPLCLEQIVLEETRATIYGYRR